MENENKLDDFFNLKFDNNSRETLRTIAVWARICAICAFVGYGIAILAAIIGRTQARASLSDASSSLTVMSRGGAIAGAFISALIGCAINYFLYRFAVDAKQGIDNLDQTKLNEGLNSFKTYFKILGIIILIVLGIFALAILIGIFAAVVKGV